MVEQPRFCLIGQPFAQFWLDPDKREEWHDRIARPPRAWEFVGRFRCPRSDKPVMAVTLRMLGSEPMGRKLWAGSMTDISGFAVLRSPETESAIDAPQGEIEQVAFALSHDMQASLHSLASHTGMLKQVLESESEEIKSAIDEVDGLTKRMQQMVDGILEYSVANLSEGRREIVSPEVVLEEAIANLRSHIDESGATIEHQPLPVLAIQRPQMLQVFQNLINNAIKFAARGYREFGSALWKPENICASDSKTTASVSIPGSRIKYSTCFTVYMGTVLIPVLARDLPSVAG